MNRQRAAALLATAPLTMIGLSLLAVPARAQDAPRYSFHLSAGLLADGLRSVSTTTGRSIGAPSDLLKGKFSPALDGRYTAEAAVDALLSGSGLRERAVGDGLVIEVDPRGRDVAPSTPPPTDIVVTGSRIRGGPVASPVISKTAADFRDQGMSDLGEVVRAIPQSFGGGQNPGLGINVPANSGTDVGGSSSINLRGLGPDATLTLLDGRRLAFTASSQSIDVSAIPLGAVERIEIVPDGASAIYGSDAVAGVANVILRHQFTGLEVGTRIGTTSDGGDFQQQYWGTGGLNWRSGHLVAAYEYGDNSQLVSNQRSFAAVRPGVTLFPAMRHHSVSLVGDQALTDNLSFSIDALYNHRSTDTTFPTVASGDLSQGRATNAFQNASWAVAPSLRLALAGDWRVTLAGAAGQERVSILQTQCALQTCSVTGSGYYRNSERAIELGGDGSLFSLPGGNAKIALGAGYRTIGFSRFALNGAAVNTNQDQDSTYLYGELDLPLLKGVPFVDRLTATGALRYERYPGIGAVATPKLGLIYAPTPDLDLKGSWGKSFRAPTLYQQYQPRTVVIFPPAFVGGSGYPATAGAFLVIGGNPALKPERATTWSATIDLHPRAVPGAHLSLTYFNVDYRNRIVAPIAFQAQALSNPTYASQITRNPSAAEQAAIVAGAANFLNITGVPYDPANIVAIIDNASVNAGHQTAHGIDLLAEYSAHWSGNQGIRLSLDVSYLNSAQQLSSSQPIIPLAGRIFSPPHWRGQGLVAWTAGPLTLAATLNYLGGVLDARTTSPVAIDGMTTLDLTARYRMADGPSLLRGVEIGVSVGNLFNAKPATIATSSPTDSAYDSTNYSPVGRQVAVSLSKRF